MIKSVATEFGNALKKEVHSLRCALDTESQKWGEAFDGHKQDLEKKISDIEAELPDISDIHERLNTVFVKYGDIQSALDSLPETVSPAQFGEMITDQKKFISHIEEQLGIVVSQSESMEQGLKAVCDQWAEDLKAQLEPQIGEIKSVIDSWPEYMTHELAVGHFRDVNRNLEQLHQEDKVLQETITELQAELALLGEEKQTLLGNVNDIRDQIASTPRYAEHDATVKRLQALDSEIAELNAQVHQKLEQSSDSLTKKLAAVEKELGADYEVDSDALAKELISHTDFSESIQSPLKQQISEFCEGQSERLKSLTLEHFNKAMENTKQLTEAYLSNIKPPEDGANGRDGLGIEAPLWESDRIYREGSVVTAHFGQYFEATKDTITAPGESEDWKRLGMGGWRWRGTKPDQTTLKEGDFYIDGGSLFMKIAGKPRMIVQRGLNGKNGLDGKDGKNGKNGADAPTVVEIKNVDSSILFAFSNGDVFEVELDLLRKMQKLQTIVEQTFTPPDDEAIALRWYRELWRNDRKYSKGDIVKFSGGFHLAVADPIVGSMESDQWIRFSSSPSEFTSGATTSNAKIDARVKAILDTALPAALSGVEIGGRVELLEEIDRELSAIAQTDLSMPLESGQLTFRVVTTALTTGIKPAIQFMDENGNAISDSEFRYLKTLEYDDKREHSDSVGTHGIISSEYPLLADAPLFGKIILDRMQNGNLIVEAEFRGYASVSGSIKQITERTSGIISNKSIGHLRYYNLTEVGTMRLIGNLTRINY